MAVLYRVVPAIHRGGLQRIIVAHDMFPKPSLPQSPLSFGKFAWIARGLFVNLMRET